MLSATAHSLRHRVALAVTALASLGLVFGFLVAAPAQGAPKVTPRTTGPTVSSVSPTSGTVSGGTLVTITGVGFTGATEIAVGDDTIAVGGGGATVVDDTTITFTTPNRSTPNQQNVTAGAELVTVTSAGVASTEAVYFTYRPLLGTVNNARVTLGSLAAASQSKPVTTTTSPPFVRSGSYSAGTTDDTAAYSYVTDVYYNVADNCGSSGLPGGKCLAYANESDERTPSNSGTWTSSITNYLGRTNVQMLKSTVECNANPNAAGSSRNRVGNTTPAVYSFCSVFGPDVVSEAFYADDTASLSFDWAAKEVTDDYEVYAYLVKVPDLTTPITNSMPHTIVLHSVGRSGTWATASAAFPVDGFYRFRFVNGSYDATGGLALGSEMYIDPVISVGLTNVITFPNPAPQTATFTTSVQSSASVATGSQVTVTSSTTSVCQVAGVSGGQVTVNRIAPGTCILTATQGSVGIYSPAEPVTVSFTFSATPAPTVTAISPATGTTSGGTPVTVTGTGFISGATVSIRGVAASSVVVVNSTTITAVTPGGAVGLATVTVTNPDNQLGSLVNGYNYIDPLPPIPWPSPTPTPCLPGAPVQVSGSAGDGAVTVSWQPPGGSCATPITEYEVVSQPGGQTCKAVSPTLTCTVTGLTNGQPYTFEVRAVASAGSGPWSSASSAVTPQGERWIKLDRGTRVADSRHDRIRTTGSTKGIPIGVRLTPHIRYDGQTSFSDGKATILVQSDGTFRWTRLIKKSKGLTAYVSWTDVKSNEVYWAKVR